MVNKSSNNPKEFTIPNGDVPSSTTVVVGFSSISRSSITKLAFKLSQHYNMKKFFEFHGIKNLLLRFFSN
jgi:hypothetical protein